MGVPHKVRIETNIVQAVKKCYKTKTILEISDGVFSGFKDSVFVFLFNKGFVALQ